MSLQISFNLSSIWPNLASTWSQHGSPWLNLAELDFNIVQLGQIWFQHGSTWPSINFKKHFKNAFCGFFVFEIRPNCIRGANSSPNSVAKWLQEILQVGSKIPQGGAKMAPRPPKEAPSRPKMKPGCIPNLSKLAQTTFQIAKIPPRGFKMLQDAPKRLQVGGRIAPRPSKLEPRWPKESPSRPQMPPRCFQEPPRCSKIHPRCSQHASKNTKIIKMPPRCLHVPQLASQILLHAPTL